MNAIVHLMRLILLLFLLSVTAEAGRPGLAAVVVDLKGPVLWKVSGGPPSRLGTSVHLLDELESGGRLNVPAGSEIELVYTGSGRRVRLVGPAESAVESLNLPAGTPLAPRERLDALEMGGIRCHCLAMFFTDQGHPRLPLIHGLSQSIEAHYLEAPDKTWQRSELRVENGVAIPLWELKPGVTYLVMLGPLPGDVRSYDYMIYRYRPEQLVRLVEAEQLADVAGPDRPVRQLILAALERQYHLYERALARVPASVRERLLEEKRAAELELD